MLKLIVPSPHVGKMFPHVMHRIIGHMVMGTQVIYSRHENNDFGYEYLAFMIIGYEHGGTGD